jgi:cytoskeletal protein CcmA (bactofilin family)
VTLFSAPSLTCIGPNSQWRGDLFAPGHVEVDGQFEGNLSAAGELRISVGASVKGRVQAAGFYLEKGGVCEGPVEIGPPEERAQRARLGSGALMAATFVS